MSTPGTLLDIFDPPEGLVGHSAALVAMTGAEDFLEAAVERFSGLRPAQRAQLGEVRVYLMLDAHASAARRDVFRPGQIPGLHELQPRAVPPESLLHAKLALLAFAPPHGAALTHLRLAVLTANFTYTSARHQLELVWKVDVPVAAAPAVDRADVAAAGTFVQDLLEHRFHRGAKSSAGRPSLTARLDELLAKARALGPANRKSRFVHSLERPLYEQIKQRLASAIDSPRNFLLCGSGFYEEASKKPQKPAVFQKLEGLGVFTGNVRRVALVEPGDAGAVAAWAKQGETAGWEVVRPADLLGHRRLHAKFMYAGYLRDGHASNGWMYLGSGNLSRRGLLTSGAMKEGNVECGVVFAVGERLGAEELARHLFWNAEAEGIDPDEWAEGKAGDVPETPELLDVPPVLSASVGMRPERALRLHWREDVPTDARVDVRWDDRDWTAVRRQHPLELTQGDGPTVLHVRYEGSGREWLVPVIDTAGRVSWQPPRFTRFEDALAALLDFPIRPTEAADDDERDGDGDGSGGPAPGSAGAEEDEKTYALHAAADLIESVADLQSALPPSMLGGWLEHLDRLLRTAFPERLVATWRAHRLDVFSHLRQPDLRSPHFDDKQRARYFEILDDAARAWGMR